MALDLLDRATGTIIHYRHRQEDPNSLSNSTVFSLYQDTAGLVWIGTGGGVSRWDPRSAELGARQPAWLGKFVTAFADAAGGGVWIASMGGGLVEYDPDSGRKIGLQAVTGRPTPLDNVPVMSLREDRRGVLWVGTMDKGIATLDSTASSVGPRQARRSAQRERRGDHHPLRGSRRTGLGRHLWRRRQRRRSGHGPGTPAAVWSCAGRRQCRQRNAFAQDSRGDVWIGTDGGGLDLARPDGTVIKVFRHDPKDPASLPSNTIYDLAVDARDRVWIGTNGGGLARADAAAAPESIRFRTFSLGQGLTSDTINGVLVDGQGSVWLSGNAGLMRLDPDSGAVKTFHAADGAAGEEFTTGAYFRLRDGRLCFGGLGGFNIFDPSHLTEPAQPPRLALTGVEILGAPAPRADPVLAAQPHPAQLPGQHRLARCQRARLHFPQAQPHRLPDDGADRSLDRSRHAASHHAHQPRAGESRPRGSRRQLRLRVERAVARSRCTATRRRGHRPGPTRSMLSSILGFVAHRLRKLQLERSTRRASASGWKRKSRRARASSPRAIANWPTPRARKATSSTA